ncbi:MAG: DUF692 domain-containing protein [Proteobacteria bacterium]|nr:DUF692 domain-containing protein [Pseudomonadota bacterium]
MKFNLLNPISSNSVGIGLRHKHHKYVLKETPKVPWFEVHSENFFAKGGPSISFLEKIRKLYPVSLHCVGLSLGSAQSVNQKHLEQLKELIDRVEPFLVSDHISWSNIDDYVLNDLLPIPYTKESLKVLCDNVCQTQDFLQREILVENPSTYLTFKDSHIEEADFINQLSKITGCKILLDINNIYVSAVNNGFDAKSYLEQINADIVSEMHLAGHSISKVDGEEILIDTHNDLVCDQVWDLYKLAAKKFKNIPTLIEWDQDLPEFDVLLDEAKKAQAIINQASSIDIRQKEVLG